MTLRRDEMKFERTGLNKARFCCALVSLSISGLVSAFGEELLVNGDFEIGAPEDDKSASFVCKAWRRRLWKESEPNSWLTNGGRDWQIG